MLSVSLCLYEGRVHLTIFIQIDAFDGVSRRARGLCDSRCCAMHGVHVYLERRHQGFVEIIVERLQILLVSLDCPSAQARA
jgi:hypothetical protein